MTQQLSQMTPEFETDWIAAPKELPEIPGGWSQRKFSFDGLHDGSTINLHLPADADAILDQEATLEEHERSGYVPYWAHLWPAAEPMAKFVASIDWSAESPILELGCGVGLVGLAALAKGANVIFSDCCRDAVETALFNAQENNFTNARGMILDWFNPQCSQQFETILACDVLYEERFHLPIVETLAKLLSPTGVCYLADPGRQLAAEFLRLAQDSGFEIFATDNDGNRWAPSGLGSFQILCISKSS